MTTQSLSSLTLGELAGYLNVKLEGDPTCSIVGLATLENARAGQLSFLSNRTYRKYLADTQASAVILSSEDVPYSKVPVLITDNPRLCLARVAALFSKRAQKAPVPGIHPTAIIGENCEIPASVSIGPNCVLGDNIQLGENVVIAPGCVIGNRCSIGAGTIIRANVVFYDQVKVGSLCSIHSGAVIGGDGFGYAFHEGAWIKVPHLAGVTIGDSVEIGANTTIDRGFLEDTRIGKGAIIDNLVLISHNVVVGEQSALAGFVGIAGSTTLGKNCMIGGNASIGGHISIGDNVHLTATAAVNHSISTPGVYSSGVPAKPNAIWRRNAARFQYLDEMAKRLRALEQKVQSIAGSKEVEVE